MSEQYIEDFIAEAERDNRAGDHEAIIEKVEAKAWPSGDPFHRLVVTLPAAGNAKADCNLQPIPDAPTLAAIKAEGNRAKMRGVASSIQLAQQLEKHYGITKPDQLMVGGPICVKTVKTKVDVVSGKGGFIRIIAFLPKGSVKGNAGVVVPTSQVPF